MKNRKLFKPADGFEISEEGVIKKYTGKETNLVIPQEIRGITVRAIVGSNPSTLKGLSFSKKKLTAVVIPSSVTKIGDYAFRNNQLTALIIPNSVTQIGKYAFENNRLTTIAIPDGVTAIGDYAFADNKLTEIVIPESVTQIGYGTFIANRKLHTITILGKVSFLPGQDILPAFDNGFGDFYESSKKKSGTYLFNGKDWSIKE